MGERKEEEFYPSFSRKDLQGLCKKYGLPANKSNSEMATSLILYLEKKNLSSKSVCEGTRSDLFALGSKELQFGVRMNLTDGQRKGCGHTASHNGSGKNQLHNHQDAQQNILQECKGFATSDKASEDVGILTQLHRESNSGVGIPENTFSSVLSSTAVTPSPTFTFDVCSEDGIQLSVDLDSSPSDWIENLKAGVHICHDIHKPTQSFHEDIGLIRTKEKSGSVVMDPSNETDKGPLEEGSLVSTDIQAQTDEAARFLSSPVLKSHSFENSKEAKAILSSRLESGTKGQLPSARSSQSKGALVTDLDVNAAVQTGMCNFKGNSLPSDSKCTGTPEHQDAGTGDDFTKNLASQQSYSSLDPALKFGELSTIVCTEIQESTCRTMSQDIGCFPSGVGKCVDLSEQLKDAEVMKCRIVKPVETTSNVNELLMWPAQAVDQSNCMPCSPVLNSRSLNLADSKSKAATEQWKVSFLGKSDRLKGEAQTHSAGSYSTCSYIFSHRSCDFQDAVNLTNGIKTENAGYPMTHEVGKETDVTQKKDAVLDPCCSYRSLNLVVPKQNGGDHCSCRSPSASNVGNLGKSNTGNEREVSECLIFDKLMEKPCKEHVDPESTRELKRKRLFKSVEGQNKFANTEGKILRSSKQFAGDAYSKRRRSSRLFTK